MPWPPADEPDFCACFVAEKYLQQRGDSILESQKDAPEAVERRRREIGTNQ